MPRRPGNAHEPADARWRTARMCASVSRQHLPGSDTKRGAFHENTSLEYNTTQMHLCWSVLYSLIAAMSSPCSHSFCIGSAAASCWTRYVPARSSKHALEPHILVDKLLGSLEVER